MIDTKVVTLQLVVILVRSTRLRQDLEALLKATNGARRLQLVFLNACCRDPSSEGRGGDDVFSLQGGATDPVINV